VSPLGAAMLLPEALLELRKTQAQLKPGAFAHLYADVTMMERQFPVGQRMHRPEEVQRVIAAVERACTLMLRGEHCLPRSVTAYRMLRRRHVPVDLVIGVQPYPFSAHAWLEYDGEVVNDDRSFIDKFKVTLHTRQIREQQA
jgi:hypothetical protein